MIPTRLPWEPSRTILTGIVNSDYIIESLPSVGERNKNLAIIIKGQLRNFSEPAVFFSFLNLIKYLKKHSNPVCFFYVNPDTTFTGSEWHYEFLQGYHQESISIEDIKQKISKVKTPVKKLHDLLSQLPIPYVIDLYNDETFHFLADDIYNIPRDPDAILVDKFDTTFYKKDTHLGQWGLIECGKKMIEEYEETHKIHFNNVITTRPDLHFDFRPNRNYFGRDKTYGFNDMFRYYPRNIFDFLMYNIHNMIDYVTGYTHIFSTNKKRPKFYNVTSPEWVRHESDLYFLYDTLKNSFNRPVEFSSPIKWKMAFNVKDKKSIKKYL